VYIGIAPCSLPQPRWLAGANSRAALRSVASYQDAGPGFEAN
jgi:hypothetical protein